MYINDMLLFCVTLDNYNRVIIKMKPGIGGSDYINASFIDVSLSRNILIYIELFFCTEYVIKKYHYNSLMVS